MRLGSEFRVHLNHLAHNLREIKKLSSSADTLLMVKANAYGHGIREVTEFAYHENGIRDFGCASLGEALFLRQHLPELKNEIYVFSDLGFFDPTYIERYKENRLLPVISDFLDLELFLASPYSKHIPLCLKFNTGMYRLGFEHTEVSKVIEKLKQHGRTSVYHLMTHFSSSGLPLAQNKRTHEQNERFMHLKQEFRAAGIQLERTSLSNSGAIEQSMGVEESHVRPGIMAYGPSSLLNYQASTWQGKNVSTLKTKILKTFMAERGTPLGYGGTITPEKALVVIVGLGYGDGISRTFTGLTKTVNGHLGKIFGRINMDMCSFLFPVEAEKSFRAHDDFVFWDSDIKEVNRMAESIGTISYELFCNISVRVPKIYKLE